MLYLFLIQGMMPSHGIVRHPPQKSIPMKQCSSTALVFEASNGPTLGTRSPAEMGWVLWCAEQLSLIEPTCTIERRHCVRDSCFVQMHALRFTRRLDVAQCTLIR